MSGLSRRRFLGFLAAAPVAVKLGIMEVFDPHRVIFDMGRSKVWTPDLSTPVFTREMLEKAYRETVFGYDAPDLVFVSRPHPLLSLSPREIVRIHSIEVPREDLHVER